LSALSGKEFHEDGAAVQVLQPQTHGLLGVYNACLCSYQVSTANQVSVNQRLQTEMWTFVRTLWAYIHVDFFGPMSLSPDAQYPLRANHYCTIQRVIWRTCSLQSQLWAI